MDPSTQPPRAPDPGAPREWDGTDAGLAALALAADPGAALADDAVPWRGPVDALGALLPAWYMPVPTARRRRRGTAIVIAVVVLGFLVIDASGLCITSGFLSWA